MNNRERPRHPARPSQETGPGIRPPGPDPVEPSSGHPAPPVIGVSERDRLIARVTELERGFGRHLARDRSSPLMASTLTMQQLKVLILLYFEGSMPGQEVARHLGVGLGTVTGIVDRIVAQGLATRREDPNDRRIRRVDLTGAGQRLATEMLDGGPFYTRILERLDVGTLQALEAALLKIEKVIQELHAEDERQRDGIAPRH